MLKISLHISDIREYMAGDHGCEGRELIVLPLGGRDGFALDVWSLSMRVEAYVEEISRVFNLQFCPIDFVDNLRHYSGSELRYFREVTIEGLEFEEFVGYDANVINVVRNVAEFYSARRLERLCRNKIPRSVVLSV